MSGQYLFHLFPEYFSLHSFVHFEQDELYTWLRNRLYTLVQNPLFTLLLNTHYENMDTCNDDPDNAWDDFRRDLDQLRKLAPVVTICMHGSPRSPHDSKDLWKTYDYRTLGILGEPYFDLSFGTEFNHPGHQTLALSAVEVPNIYTERSRSDKHQTLTLSAVEVPNTKHQTPNTCTERSRSDEQQTISSISQTRAEDGMAGV